MNYLAIDTSSKNLTVIICKDDKIYKYFDGECGVNHSVRLMPEIEKLVNQTGFDFKKADFLAVSVGAGSFTGIRIGVSTIKAMAFSYNLPALAVTSFDLIAYNEKKAKRLAVIDAGHNGYYVCGYDQTEQVLPPTYIDGEKLKELSNEYELYSSALISGVNTKVVSPVEGFINAIEIKKHFASKDLDLIVPLYVRKSQAEEGRL